MNLVDGRRSGRVFIVRVVGSDWVIEGDGDSCAESDGLSISTGVDNSSSPNFGPLLPSPWSRMTVCVCLAVGRTTCGVEKEEFGGSEGEEVAAIVDG